jgi:CGNR zinc finger protein
MPDPAPLNALASDSQARLRLVDSCGALRQELLWEDGSSAARLARRLIAELADLDSTRLRKCARPQCTLLFYDTTRSRTRRWHAEDPCGWRERDHSRRATPTTRELGLVPARIPGVDPARLDTGLDDCGCYRWTLPEISVCVPPPIQIAPSASVVTWTRPRRPSAVP